MYGVFNEGRLRNNFTGTLYAPAGDGLEQLQRSGTFGGRALHQRHLHLFGQTFSLEAGLSGRGDLLHQTQRPYAEADGRLLALEVDAQVRQVLGSGWLELAWAPGDWRFMLGGRVDVLHVEAFDALAFGGRGGTRRATGPHLELKAGLERQLGPLLRAFASYGDGFRTPQARQLSQGETAPFVNVHGGELGLRLTSRFLEASAAGFLSGVANDFFFDHTAGTTRFIGPTLRGGGQLQLTSRPVTGFVIAGNLTLATAQLTERAALLPYFAPVVGRLDAGWTRTWALPRFPVTPRLGLGATVIGPRPLPYDEWSESWVVVDARAGLRVGPLEATFDVQNLLDVRWRDGEYVFASDWGTRRQLPSRHFTAGAPRTFFFNLELHL